MKIVVNWITHEIEPGAVEYCDIVRLAYPTLANTHRDQLPVMSVTYIWREGKPSDVKREGILPPRSVVEPAEGMVFSCYRTGNA